MGIENIIGRIVRERGALANIHHVFSEFPVGMEAHYDFYSKLMLSEKLPLSREEREFLAVATSRANREQMCQASILDAIR